MTTRLIMKHQYENFGPNRRNLPRETSLVMRSNERWLYSQAISLVCPSSTRCSDPRGGGGTIGRFGWGCTAGTLEPLAYTRAS